MRSVQVRSPPLMGMRGFDMEGMPELSQESNTSIFFSPVRPAPSSKPFSSLAGVLDGDDSPSKSMELETLPNPDHLSPIEPSPVLHVEISDAVRSGTPDEKKETRSDPSSTMTSKPSEVNGPSEEASSFEESTRPISEAATHICGETKLTCEGADEEAAVKRMRPATEKNESSTAPIGNPLYIDIPRFDASKMPPEELKRVALSVPICFVSNMTSTMAPHVFTMDYLSEKYGDHSVDVLVQHPDAFGFPVPPNKRVPEQTLRNYVDYAKQLEGELSSEVREAMDAKVFGLMAGGRAEDHAIGQVVGRHFGEEEGSYNVKFCVNVDCGDWPTVVSELEKLPEWCRWGKHDELLSCLPRLLTVPGLSLPQLYLKVPGVWTGGHEENLRFYSINSNHGPGNSVWGAIAPEHAKRFREAVLEKKECNIYAVEGRWFPDLEFCKEHDVPVYLGTQRPGDTAILNGATLHWVRSGGFAVNSSWNFGVRDARQLDLAFERDQINFKLGVRNIVPLRSLGIGLLKEFQTRKKRETMDLGVREAAFIDRLMRYMNVCSKQESRYLQMIRQENATRHRKSIMPMIAEPPDSVVLICDCCWREIVHYYIVCETCADINVRKGISDDVDKAKPIFYCPPCGLEHGSLALRHKLEARYKVIQDEFKDLSVFVRKSAEFFEQKKAAQLSAGT